METKPLRLAIVTHAAIDSKTGNVVTANRWATILRRLGHVVTVGIDFCGETDILIAIHATHTADQIKRFKQQFPGRCVVVALAGTDIYRDLANSQLTRSSIDLADHVVALQGQAIQRLPPSQRRKCHVIYQSARRPEKLPPKLPSCFEVSVSAHLRPIKDPFRTVEAALLLPTSSKIRVSQIGIALDAQMQRQAESFARLTGRYHWFGGQAAGRARWLVARSRVLVNSSLMEGGANVIAEALVAGVPVLASKMDGNIGMLGEDYSGYFHVGDTRALADLLLRLEVDMSFYHRLKSECHQRAKLFSIELEVAAWRKLLDRISC